MHGPFGLAAGFDKNAVAIDGMSMLGFDHIEIGTVTGEPQPGNPKKRLFRLVADRALINRMGFNNEGSAAVAERLAARRPVFSTTVGVNIGKTKLVPEAEAVGDYVKSTERLARHADYLVVNVSSPNTPGLRNLQATEALRPCSAPCARRPTGPSPGGGSRCSSRSPRTSRTRTSTRSPISRSSWDWTASSPRTPPSPGTASG